MPKPEPRPPLSAQKLFAGPCECVLAAGEAEQFPKTRMPEVAFVGRSNVGKSSLINALVNRKNLARASNTPGRTQQIVFFDLGGKLMLADLPGYGHAEAPRAEIDHWNELVHRYLQTRSKLRCVLLLIDARHGLMANDLEMMKFLDRAAVSYQIVLTKTDKLRSTEHEARRRQIEAMLEKHPAARSGILYTSAAKDVGLEEVKGFLAGYVS